MLFNIVYLFVYFIEPDVSNDAQESTKPVVVNFGGIKGLGIGGAVLLGNNKENNPLRYVCNYSRASLVRTLFQFPSMSFQYK